jgi:glucose dehydrogenase
MPHHLWKLTVRACTTLLASAIVFAQGYSLTVNKDRLVNAMNEPQNWLLMNGDYGSTRYSRLTQINRDTVKNLRMVWALALGGMQDVGQNGPENEVNPLIDNGYMYTTDGWGTVYKIDIRNPNRAQFVWTADPGVKHEGNRPQTRGIALWEDMVIANTPDGRVLALNRDNGEVVWDKKIATKTEFGGQEKFAAAPLVAEGKVIIQNGAGDAGTRGWVGALDAKPGGTITTPGRQVAEDSGRPDPTIRPPSFTLSAPATPIRSTTRSSGPATISIRIRRSRSTSRPASWPGISSTHRTTRGTSTRSACTCSTTPRSMA